MAGFGRAGSVGSGVLARWAHLAGEARAAAARAGGAGPPGGTARERSRLVRALSRARFSRCASDDAMVSIIKATILVKLDESALLMWEWFNIWGRGDYQVVRSCRCRVIWNVFNCAIIQNWLIFDY